MCSISRHQNWETPRRVFAAPIEPTEQTCVQPNALFKVAPLPQWLEMREFGQPQTPWMIISFNLNPSSSLPATSQASTSALLVSMSSNLPAASRCNLCLHMRASSHSAIGTSRHKKARRRRIKLHKKRCSSGAKYRHVAQRDGTVRVK